MEQFCLSIVIPCYNVENYVARCISSCINSNRFFDYEIIAVDDGSTDNTYYELEILKKQYDNTIKIIKQQNKGLSGARNTGIINSTGKYIMFLDSDDYLVKGWDKIIYEAIRNNNQDLFVFNHYKINKEKQILSLKHNELGDISSSNFNDIVKVIFTKNYNKSNWSAWGKLFKRDIIISNNIWFDEKNYGSEDLKFCYEYSLFSKSVFYCEKPLVYYDISNFSSITHNINQKTFISLSNVLDYIYNSIPSYNYDSKSKRILYSCISIWQLYIIKNSSHNEEIKIHFNCFFKSKKLKLMLAGLILKIIGIDVFKKIFKRR